MGYLLTTSVENAALANSVVDPKTHTPDPQVQDLGLRLYSPSLGRWLSKDPIGEEGGDNLQRYCHNSPQQRIDAFGTFDEWVENIAPLDEQPVNDSTGNPADGTAHFNANESITCECVGAGGAQLINCVLSARPRTRYIPDWESDPFRDISNRAHEQNHHKVWSEHFIPSYRSLFYFYAGDRCCNCAERAAEFASLWAQLKTKLDQWETGQEYPSGASGPHKQPRFDYGTGYGSISPLVNQVAEGIQTICK